MDFNSIERKKLSKWGIELLNFLEYHINRIESSKISNRSFIDGGVWLDIVLYMEDHPFDYSISFSIRKDFIDIKSTFLYLTLYADEHQLHIVKNVCTALFNGQFEIKEYYSKNGRLISKHLFFKNLALEEFNSKRSAISSFLFKVHKVVKVDGEDFSFFPGLLRNPNNVSS